MALAFRFGEFTALETEHILPDMPEGELRQSFTTANPGKGYDALAI
jgi:hypothetical protein